MNMGESAIVSFDNIKRENGKLTLTGGNVSQAELDLYHVIGVWSFAGSQSTSDVEITDTIFQKNMTLLDSEPYMLMLGSLVYASGLENFSLTNVRFLENKGVNVKAQSAQGTVYLNEVKNAVITEGEFSSNSLLSKSSTAMGGAIQNWKSHLSITGTVFSYNENRSEVDGALGGAIYSYSSVLDVKAASFVGNTVVSESGGNARGGAIMANASTQARFEDTVFTDNTADGTTVNSFGGAVYNYISRTDFVVTKDVSWTGNSVVLRTGETSSRRDEQGGFLFLYSDSSESKATADFDVAAQATLTIGVLGQAGYDSIASKPFSLLSKSGTGTMRVNSSMDYFAGDIAVQAGTLDVLTGLSSASSVSVATGATLLTGFTRWENESLTTGTGLGKETKLVVNDGGRLGSHVFNTGSTDWVLTYDELNASIKSAFSPYVGEGFSGYTYVLSGRVTMTDTKVLPGENVEAGSGSTVELGDTQPEGGLVLSGGTIDASKVSPDAVLQADKITGDSGTLVTCKGQEIVFTQDQSAGYDICGSGGDGSVVSGANITIGTCDGTAAPSIELKGKLYASDRVSVNSGTLVIGADTTVGVEGNKGTITIGAAEGEAVSSTARVIANGVVHNDVVVRASSEIRGSGKFSSSVSLEKGSLLYVGNSPGYSEINHLSTGSGADSSVLGFYLDGTTKATFAQKGEGTYSNMKVGTLSWSSGTKLLLEVGWGILNGNSADFTWDLIEYGQAEGETLTGSLSGDQVTLAGASGILDPDSVQAYWEGNMLKVKGSLNSDVVEQLVAADGARIANALWSSTRSVSRFALNAVSQLDSCRSGDNSFWVSGLGDFASVSGDAVLGGYDYNGGGYSVGADHSFSRNFTAGLSFGQTFGTNKAKEGGYASVEQAGIMGGAYIRCQKEMNKSNSLLVDGYAAYGNVENKGTMDIFGSQGAVARDTWDDNVVVLGLKASWQIKLNETAVLTPFVGMDYVHGAQQDINMMISSGGRVFYDGSMQNWSIPVGVTWRKSLSLGGEQYLVPEVTVAYVGDVSRNNPSVKTDVLGQSCKYEGVNPGRNAVRADAGLRWVMSRNWNVGVSYNVESRSDMTNQAVNASLNYTF